MGDMTIEEHLAAHEAKVLRKKKALIYRQERNKRRGLAAFVARLKVAPYPFCRTPKECAGKGYCTKDLACNE